MPLGLISMPFIVKRGDHILFSLTVDACYQDGEAVCVLVSRGTPLSLPHLLVCALCSQKALFLPNCHLIKVPLSWAPFRSLFF